MNNLNNNSTPRILVENQSCDMELTDRKESIQFENGEVRPLKGHQHMRRKEIAASDLNKILPESKKGPQVSLHL